MNELYSLPKPKKACHPAPLCKKDCRRSRLLGTNGAHFSNIILKCQIFIVKRVNYTSLN